MSPSLFFNNKKFISAREASALTGYSTDYIGQLARANKIDSRRVGRIWYIGEESILAYKNLPIGIGKFVEIKKVVAPLETPSPSTEPNTYEVEIPDFKNTETEFVTIELPASHLKSLPKYTFHTNKKFITSVCFSLLIVGFLYSNNSLGSTSKKIAALAGKLLTAAISQSLTPPSSPSDINSTSGAVADAFKNYVVSGSQVATSIGDALSIWQSYIAPKPTTSKASVAQNTPIKTSSSTGITNASLVSALRSLLSSNLPSDILEKLRGPKGADGARGPSGTAIAQNGAPSPLPSIIIPGGYIPPSTSPTNNFPGGSIFSATSLSSQELIADTARITNLTVGGLTTLNGALNVQGGINSNLTNGSILFQKGATIGEDNSNFFWDNTTKRLGIGTNAPGSKLHIVDPTGATLFLDSPVSVAADFGSNLTDNVNLSLKATDSASINLLNGDSSTFWTFGVDNISGNTIKITDNNAGETRFSIDGNGLATFGADVAINGGNFDLASTLVNLSGTDPVIDLSSASTLSINTVTNRPVTFGTGLSTFTGDVNITSGVLNLNNGTGGFIENEAGDININTTSNNPVTFGTGTVTIPNLVVTNSQGNFGLVSIDSNTTTGTIFTITGDSLTSGKGITEDITANAGNGQITTGHSINITDATVGGGGYTGLEINTTGAGAGAGNKYLLDINPGVNKEIVFDSTGALRPTTSVASNTNTIGSPSFYWKNGYFDQISANNIAGTVVSGATSSTTWTIGSTEAGDTNEAIIFQRNSGSGNALIQWNAGAGDLRYLSVNYPLNNTYTVSDASIGTNINLYSGALTNNTTSGTQKLLSLTNTGTGTTEAGLYINNTGTGTTAVEIAGTWTNGLVTNNNSINAGTGALTAGTSTLDNLIIGGGYGSTGVTISNTGNIQANGNATIDGTLTSGLVNGQNISSAANFTGTANIATSLSINGGAALTTTNQTGTGSIVMSTSPTLVTPTIGAATATSITIGANTVDASEWANLDGLNQTLTTTSSPTFAGLTNSALTSGRVTFASTAGLLVDDADLTFSGDTLTTTKLAGTTMVGNLLFTDNTYDIGASGATRPRTIYAGTSIVTPALTVTSATTLNGDLTITKQDPAVIYNAGNTSDTKFWSGVTDDNGNDDDDLFQIGDGATPGTNPFLSINTSGNVGIGTTSPGGALTIGAGGALRLIRNDAGYYHNISTTNDGLLTFTGQNGGYFTFGLTGSAPVISSSAGGGSSAIQFIGNDINFNSADGATINFGKRSDGAFANSIDYRFSQLVGSNVFMGLGNQAQVTLTGALNQDDVLIKRNVTGAFAEDGSLLRLQKDITGTSTYGGNYLLWGTTASSLGAIDENGNIGIGITNPTSKLHIVDTTSTAGYISNYTALASTDTGGNTTYAVKGINTASGTSGSSIPSGGYFVATNSMTGTATGAYVYGVNGAAITSSTRPTNQLFGSYSTAIANTSVGTVDLAGGLQTAGSVGASSTITDYRHLYITDVLGSGTVTTQYGLYIPNLTKGGTNYSIYTGSAQSYFGGNVGIGTTNPATTLDVNGVTTFRGNIIAGTDNTYDIGASGATRPRTGYFGTSVITPAATISGVLNLSGTGQIHQLSGHNFVQGDATHTYMYGGTAGFQIRKSDNSVALWNFDDSGNVALPGGVTITTPSSTISINGTTFTTASGVITFPASVIHQLGTHNFFQGDATNTYLYGGTNGLHIRSADNSTALIDISNTGNLTFATDNTQDIGATGATRPRTGYFGTSIISPLVTTPSLTTATGAMTITPAAGSNLNVNLSTTGDFAVNTNHLYVDTSTSNVGIGTTTPGSFTTNTISNAGGLSILKSVSNSGPLVELATSTTLDDRLVGGITFNNIDNTDISGATRYTVAGITALTETTDSNADDDSGAHLLFFTKAESGSGISERMRITSVGNIGIGTSIPDGTLHINTATAGTITPNIGGDDLVVENGNDGGISILTPDNKLGAVMYGSPSDAVGALSYWDYTNSTLNIATSKAGGILKFKSGNEVDAMTILSTGNVGIGTTNPAGKLTIKGDGTTTGVAFQTRDSSDNANVTISDSGLLNLTRGTAASVSTKGLQIRFDNTNNTGHISASQSGVANYPLYLGGDGFTAGNGIYIDGVGNVGLNTNSPVTYGTFAVRRAVTGIVSGFGISGSFSDNANATVNIVTGATSLGGLFSDNNLVLGAGNSEKIRVLSSNGNVGIGTTNPANKLDVNGGIRATLDATGANTAQIVTMKSDGTLTTDSSTFTWDSSNDLLSVNGLNIYSTGVRAAGSNNLQLGSANTFPSITVLGTNGNVGVGTATPGYKFTTSATSGTTQFGLVNSSTNDNWQIYLNTVSGDSDLRFFESGSTTGDRLVLYPGGNIGIGTAVPAAKLDLVVTGGGANPATSGTAPGIGLIQRMQDSSTAVLDIGLAGGGGAWLNVTNSANLATHYPLMLNPNGGNVGIGTTNPATYKLEVAGTLGVTTSGSLFTQSTNGSMTGLGVRNSNAGNAAAARIEFGNDAAAFSGTVTMFGSAHATKPNVFQVLNQQNANLELGGYGVSTMYIGNGNVGIGTTNPGYPLQVSAARSASTDMYALQATGTGATGDQINLLFRQNTGADASIYTLASISSINENSGGASGALAFSTRTSGSTFTEKMRILSGGNVGIGTTNPAIALTIKQPAADSGMGVIDNDSTDMWSFAFTSNVDQRLGVRFNSTAKAYVSSSDGSWNSLSDSRVKTNVTDLSSNTLNKVMSLRPVSFNFIDNPNSQYQSMGFIAQEVDTLFPEVVLHPGSPDQYYAIDYSKFGVLAIKAVQEMNLNLESIAGTNTISTLESQSFMDSFFTNMFSKTRTWLADAGNGITDLFADTFHAKDKICINETCINEVQLQTILANASGGNNGENGGGGNGNGGNGGEGSPASDTTPPVITLTGDATINLNIGDTYSELGAEAVDETDGSVAVVITGNVDTNVDGTYTLHYNAHDIANNNATEVTRTVIVGTGVTPPPPEPPAEEPQP